MVSSAWDSLFNFWGTDDFDSTRLRVLHQVMTDTLTGMATERILQQAVERLNQHITPNIVIYSALNRDRRLRPLFPSDVMEALTDCGVLESITVTPDYLDALTHRTCISSADWSSSSADMPLAPFLPLPAAAFDIPIRHENNVMGVLHLIVSNQSQVLAQPPDQELCLLNDVALMLSMVLHREQMGQECQWAELALRESELALRSLYDRVPVMLHLTDCTDRLIEVSTHWLKRMGYDRQEVIGRRLIDFMTEESRCYAETAIASIYLETGGCRDIPYKLITKQGHILDVLLSGTLERDARGHIIRGIEVLTDITQQRQIEHQLFREKELAQVTLQSIGDAIITTDINGQIDYLNPIAEQLTGWRVHEVKGLPISQVVRLIHEVTRTPIPNPIEQVLQCCCRVDLGEGTLLLNRCGTEFAILDSAAPILTADGVLLGAVMVFRDVSQQRLMERQMAWQANHDSLTGLINRRAFERKLTQAIASAKQRQETHILCYLDLDQFKVINDSYGHGAGDELLRQVALLLRSHIGSADVVARLGGDEFGILLHNISLEQAQSFCETMRQRIQEFRFSWHVHEFTIRASFGLVQIDSTSQDLAQVLTASDTVCYAAKKRGRNRVYLYRPDDPELAQDRADRQWIERISRGFETNRFQLYAQPIALTDASSQAGLHHYEILLRFLNEQNQLVLPLVFMPAAEQYTMMPQIDRWVIRKFFQLYTEQFGLEELLQTTGDGGSAQAYQRLFTINLSGATVNDDQFLSFLKHQFQEFQVSPQLICFEITERVAIANLEKAAQLIQEIKQLGCQFALDDFGSGVSSFNYLRHLPIDYLKIDGNFVRSLLSDPVNCAIVESINHIGHLMGIQTIAEFVETSEIRTRLCAIGVDYVQGYAIQEPIPLLETRGFR